MRDLKIEKGDLILNEGGLKTIGRAEKVAQDLRFVLLNDVGFNRFLRSLGASLDDFVGVMADEELLHEIRQRVRAAIDVYQEEQLKEIRERIEAYGDPVYAIGLSDPSSIVKEWNEVTTQIRADRVIVGVSFTTFTEDTDFARFAV